MLRAPQAVANFRTMKVIRRTLLMRLRICLAIALAAAGIAARGEAQIAPSQFPPGVPSAAPRMANLPPSYTGVLANPNLPTALNPNLAAPAAPFSGPPPMVYSPPPASPYTVIVGDTRVPAPNAPPSPPQNGIIGPLLDGDYEDERFASLYLFHGYSSWRGIAEGTGSNNNGFLYGGNWGTGLGKFSDWSGIGAQLGASYGFYDLNGRSSGFADNDIQQQVFVTAGLFRKADQFTNFSVGVVYDAMVNGNFGQFAVSPFLSQLRGQISYALNDSHEVGFWTALRMSGDNRNINGPLSFRPVDQFNFFWHHKFSFGADGWTWIGFPDFTKLGSTHGSLGNYIFGGTLVAPLSRHFGVYTDLQYMAPDAHIGPVAASRETFFVSLGLILYPGGHSPSASVKSPGWLPFLPVGNNGSFLVDTNRTF